MSGPLIYYIRHGQTDWNAEQRYQGQRDIPLNDTGRGQAHANGKKLSDLLGTADGFQFISSPLSRARETMEIIRSEMGLDPETYQTDDRLTEISYGDFEGSTQAEIKARDRALYYERKNNMWDFRPKNGESQADVTGRVKEWISSLEDDQKYVVTAHGAVGRVVRHLAAGVAKEDLSRFSFPQDKFYRFFEGSEELI